MATTKKTSKSTTKKTTRKSTASATRSRAKPKAAEPGFEPQDDEVSQAEVAALVAPEDAPDVAAPEAKADPVPEPETKTGGKTAKAPAPVQGVTRSVSDGSNSAIDKLVKKDLIDRVIARSGVKPRHARQVTDALLVELGAMLEEAETLQLQPLGNLKVQRRKDLDDGEIIITKLRRKKPVPESKDPLVPAAE